MLIFQLLELYFKLALGVTIGYLGERYLPSFVADFVGKFLFWIGVPLSIIAFLRRADLSSQIWLAPAIAWLVLLLGAILAWLWLKQESSQWQKPTQGSFLLASMIGNTGYLGFPISLAIVGEKYFAWALFYDLLGSALGAYSFGVLLAAYFGNQKQKPVKLIIAMFQNPALGSLGLGLILRQFPLAETLETSLQNFAWSMIFLALILIGMRLAQIHSWQRLSSVTISLAIKMLILPLVVGLSLAKFGITGSPQLVLVLQTAMPPAFATLVLAEAYNLDRELTVTALAVGSISLLFTLPIWLFLFES